MRIRIETIVGFHIDPVRCNAGGINTYPHSFFEIHQLYKKEKPMIADVVNFLNDLESSIGNGVNVDIHLFRPLNQLLLKFFWLDGHHHLTIPLELDEVLRVTSEDHEVLDKVIAKAKASYILSRVLDETKRRNNELH